jgi:hypothetical protein
MAEQIQITSISLDEFRQLIKTVIKECLKEMHAISKEKLEKALSVRETCSFLGISRPTLKKYVDSSLIRRHDLGRKKKVFYLSELQEDIKRLSILTKRGENPEGYERKITGQ